METEDQEPKRRRRRFFASRRRAEGTEARAAADGSDDRPTETAGPSAEPGEAPETVLESTGRMGGTVKPRPKVDGPDAESIPVGGPPTPSGEVQEPPEPRRRVNPGPVAADSTPEEPAAGMPGGPEMMPRPDVKIPAILAIANQKGGVGKTTTAVNLGAALAELGFRVLVVDLDPQGNATTGLGINARDLQQSIYDVVMNDLPVEDCVEPTSLKNLFVAPATIDLAGAEIELVPAFSRELKLRRALEEVREDYDITLIDCPPSLGLLTVNALAAADGIIVPIQCEYYALEGLGQLLRNVALVRSNLNASLAVWGIVLTMYDARTKLADQVEKEVRAHFGSTVYRQTIPRNVRIGEAPSYGQPITVYDPMSRGAIAYRELANEVSSGITRRTG